MFPNPTKSRPIILDHNHDSEPRENPEINSNAGKIYCKLNSQKESSKSFEVGIPIAFRNGVRSCIPIALCLNSRHIQICLHLLPLPLSCPIYKFQKNVQEVLKVPKWKEVVLDKRALEKNKS